jgi:hypothetical protein
VNRKIEAVTGARLLSYMPTALGVEVCSRDGPKAVVLGGSIIVVIDES